MAKSEFGNSMTMKAKLSGVVTTPYMMALRKHLKPGPRWNWHLALRPGREAVAFGVETLELVRIHEPGQGH